MLLSLPLSPHLVVNCFSSTTGARTGSLAAVSSYDRQNINGKTVGEYCNLGLPN